MSEGQRTDDELKQAGRLLVDCMSATTAFNSISVLLTDEEWIGKILDEDSLELIIQLSEKYRFNVDGEGGEYETLVVYGPHFDGKIVVTGSTMWHGIRGELQISNISS